VKVTKAIVHICGSIVITVRADDGIEWFFFSGLLTVFCTIVKHLSHCESILTHRVIVENCVFYYNLTYLFVKSAVVVAGMKSTVSIKKARRVLFSTGFQVLAMIELCCYCALIVVFIDCKI